MARGAAARAADRGVRVRVQLADFTADFASIETIRSAVFIVEQRVPEELEFDDRDPVCVHLLVLVAGQPVGTGRVDLEHDGKIGRVAVLAPYRRHGVGKALMERLHEIARERGLRQVWCNAQTSAVPFYGQLGYRATGDLFEEAGIEHVRMERPL
jgi:predicted GNAT family N-acyltransferase